MPQRYPFRRGLFATVFATFSLIVGGMSVGLQALLQGVDESSPPTTAIQRSWDDLQAIANRHHGQLPSAGALAQEAQADQPAVVYRGPTSIAAFDRLKTDKTTFAVLHAAGGRLELLAKSPGYDEAKVSGRVGDALPHVSRLHPSQVDWSETPYFVGVALLLAFFLAAWLERDARRVDEFYDTKRFERWREYVPGLSYGPSEPIDDFSVLAPQAFDRVDEEQVLFATALLRWSRNNWERVQWLPECELRLPLTASAQAIAEVWFSYCAGVAKANAEMGAIFTAAQAEAHAELERLAERRRQHVPIADLLPKASEIAKSLPLQPDSPT